MKKRFFLSLFVLAGISIEILQVKTIISLIKKNTKTRENSKKHLSLFLLLNQWIEVKQEGKSIVDYFHENKIKSIAIYGMSYVGERLYDELKNTDIDIKYIIDKNAEKIYSVLDVYLPEEQLPEADAIVVTPIVYYEEIKTKLKQKLDCQIISLEDILNEL